MFVCVYVNEYVYWCSKGEKRKTKTKKNYELCIYAMHPVLLIVLRRTSAWIKTESEILFIYHIFTFLAFQSLIYIFSLAFKSFHCINAQ